MDIVNASPAYYNLELDGNNNFAYQPEKIQLKLKPHQLTSLYKAIEMETKGELIYKIHNCYLNSNTIDDNLIEIKVGTNIGILGDKVGYGKTLLALSLIASNDLNNIHINPNQIKTFNNNYRSYNYLSLTYENKLIQRNSNIIGTTLVIVPRGPVFVQWEETVKKNTNLKLLSITNLNFIKNNIPKYNGNNDNEILEYFESFDLVLIKNTTFKVLCDYFNNFGLIKNWKRIMIDEAHDILSKLPQHLNYYYLWFISGTYIDLLKGYNNTYYTMGIRDLLNDQMINLILVKNSTNFIKNSFDIPEPIEKTYLCKLASNYMIARQFVSNSVIDKINANDFAGAIKDLGGKNETEDNIIELVSKELKKELKNKEREREYINDLDIPIDDKEQKLKKIDIEIENQINKINDLTERIKSLSSNNCIICMDNVKHPILLECTHLFCGGCIMKWIDKNNNCPYCRAPIPSYNNLIAIVNKNEEKERTWNLIHNYLPSCCFICKRKRNNEYDRFHLDHINIFNKTKEICTMVASGYEIDDIYREIDKCQYMCINCHHIITCIENRIGFIKIKKRLNKSFINNQICEMTLQNETLKLYEIYNHVMDNIYKQLQLYFETKL